MYSTRTAKKIVFVRGESKERNMFPREAQVVVIGGGVLGTSAALHLAKAGVKNIVLVDRGPLASGTTPFAAGQVGYLSNTPDGVPFLTYCIEFFENFEKETGYPIDFRQNGSLRIALQEQHVANVESYRKTVKKLGDYAELIAPAQAKELAPTLELDSAEAILHLPREGFLKPRAVAAGYASGARDLGVDIQIHTHVTGIGAEDGRVRSVETNRGAIETEWVVLAAGAWTRQFAQIFPIEVKSIPVRHQAFVTAPLSEVSLSQPIVRVVDSQIYMRPELGGGLLVGGYGFRPTSFDMDEYPPDFEIAALEPDRIYYERLRAAAESVFPCLKSASIIQERRGLPTVTPDAFPIVDESSSMKGMVVVTGCQVGGIARSPAVGRIVTDIIKGERTLEHPADLSLERFGDEYNSDASLRSRVEHVDGHLYWGVQ